VQLRGFFQVIAAAKSGRLLGVRIVGAKASDLISEAAIAVQKRTKLAILEQKGDSDLLEDRSRNLLQRLY